MNTKKMEESEDVRVFSRFISTPLLEWSIRRDSIRFDKEHNSSQIHKGSLIPLYDGQYNIDYYLYTLESYFSQGSVQEEDKAIVGEQHLTGEVLKGYEAMQWGRIHRGEAYIDDWPTMKEVLKVTFNPLNSWVMKEVEVEKAISIADRVATMSVHDICEEQVISESSNGVLEDSVYVHNIQAKEEETPSTMIDIPMVKELSTYEDPFVFWCTSVPGGNIRSFMRQSSMVFTRYSGIQKKFGRAQWEDIEQQQRVKHHGLNSLFILISCNLTAPMHNSRSAYLRGGPDENGVSTLGMKVEQFCQFSWKSWQKFGTNSSKVGEPDGGPILG